MSKSLRSWNLVSMPNEEWASVVFPELPPDEALEKLWQVVLSAVRADADDPIKAWQDHAEQLRIRKDALNERNFHKLHFQSPTCDLEVELIENHYWQGGEKINEWGQAFIANIPTEEVHTMPKRTGVNGWVKNTRPLLISGQTVDDFRLTFQDGKVVEADIGQGRDVLLQQLELDEGSSYLGEVALVAHSSPISQTGIIFHDTLFDENASCHLALGNAYPASLIGGRSLTKQQLQERGANTSVIHIDFMIGSDQLDITGYTQDGEAVPVFQGGEWVIG
jgi:aminopeptidase